MLDSNEMINMARFIKEKTTRCRSDVANVFDRIMELESVATSLEDLVRQQNPVQGSDLGGVPSFTPEEFEEAENSEEGEDQMEFEFAEATDEALAENSND